MNSKKMMETENDKTSLLKRWKSKNQDKKGTQFVSKAPDGALIPLSNGQRRLWFLQQLHPDNPVYNFTEVYTFHGNLNVLALVHGLQSVYDTHDILRSSCHLDAGMLIQKIDGSPKLNVAHFDLSMFDGEEKRSRQKQIMTADALKPFDLSEPPLLRASLLHLNESEHVLLITMHHIIVDKWSIDIFLAELAHYYKKVVSQDQDPMVPKINRLQFTDYAYWEQKSEIETDKLDYWLEKLAGDIPLLDLPTDFSRPSKPSFNGKVHVRHFSTNLSKELLSLAKRLETTPYTLLLATFYVLLHRYSGHKDIWVGSPISQRHEKSLEDIIGFFDETIVLRTNIASSMPFAALVKQVKKVTLEAFSNSKVPFDLLVKKLSPERSLNTNPFFSTMFIYHDVRENPSFGTDLRLDHSFFNPGVSKFDLTLYVSNEQGRLSSSFEYATDLFTETMVARLHDHLHLLLENVVHNPDSAIDQIEMLTPAEKNFFFLKKLPESAPFKEFTGIHHIIEAVAKKSPDAVAVSYKNDAITYAKLMDETEQLARVILESTHGTNKIVALCLERSIDLMVGLVAILKAGCAYLPLDPEYPIGRSDYMLSDSSVATVLTQRSLLRNFDNFKGMVLSVDDRPFNITGNLLLPLAKKDNMAYVIYTSGSTGKPKGVPITHANIINSTQGRLNFYPENPKTFLLMSSVSFDSSKAGIFWTLCTGGTLVLTEKRIEQDIEKLSEVIAQNSITHTLMLPSLYQLILQYATMGKLKSLSTVIVAGEACTSSMVKAHFQKLPNVALYNEYGPTEATVWALAHKMVEEDTEGSVPIGKPVANSQIYLLNEAKNLVPYGARGEIYIGGQSLAGHYLNLPKRTNDVYIGNPFTPKRTEKLYRTGDLGRYNADGNMEFLGRNDDQVKIRGHRIEIAEIEDAISKYVSGKQVSVVVKDVDKTQQLIAFMQSSDKTVDEASVKAVLKNTLPNYMIPARIMKIDEFPLLPNGKIDKKKLLNAIPDPALIETSSKKAPVNATQKKLIEIWEEILQVSPIGIEDNFFEIGGDSISSIQIIAKARKLGMKLQPNDFFINPTIESMVKSGETTFVDKKWEFMIPLKKEGSKSPLFCFHAGEGYILFYRHLPKYIHEDRPIFTIQPRGADGQKSMHQSVEEMAIDYLKEIEEIQPSGTYNLLFYCHGSLAVEISNLLTKKGKRANLIMIDGMIGHVKANHQKPMGDRLNIYLRRFMAHPFTTIKNSIKSRIKLYITPYFIRLNNDVQGKTRIALRNQLIQNHIEYNWKKFDAHCTLILPESEHIALRADKIKAWKEWCRSEVKVMFNSGHHFNQFDEPHVKTLCSYVERAIVEK